MVSILRFTAGLVALLLCINGRCAPARIDTDGPDFVESSEVVGKGRFQFEVDVVGERDRRDTSPITALSTPTLLRYGVNETIEFRVQTDGLQRVIDHNAMAGAGTTQGGTGATELGVKWHSRDRDMASNTPAVSWILHLGIPSGTGNFADHGFSPSLRSVVTWELPHDLAFGFMPGLRYGSGPDGHRHASLINGLVLNKQWTERFRTFIENAAPQIASAGNGGIVMTWDVGAAYLAGPDWQVGFRGSAAANRNTPGNQLLIELAGRF